MRSQQTEDSRPKAVAGTPGSQGLGRFPAHRPCLSSLPRQSPNCGDLTSVQKPEQVLEPGGNPYNPGRGGIGRA